MTMGLGLAALGLAALGLAGGCGVGDGVGAVRGQLYVADCAPNKILGTPLAPAEYDMQPDFFAGEPIEDVRAGGRENRIVIRLETANKRIRQSSVVTQPRRPLGPVKDLLLFDVENFPTALCVRAAALGIPSPNPAYCEIREDPVEGRLARVRVGPEQPIRVSFAPRAECYQNIWVVGTALGDDPQVADVRQPVPADRWESFVDFKEFGSASTSEIRPQFKVEFGERINAKGFQLTLEDDRVVKAVKREEIPPPSELKGLLTGYFDFDLERGQGAQTFP